MGIDATIPENVPRYRYNRIIYHNQGKAVLDDYLSESPSAAQPPAAGDDAIERLAERTLDMLREKRLTFSELLDAFSDQAFATVVALVGRLNERKQITLDEEGKYMPGGGRVRGPSPDTARGPVRVDAVLGRIRFRRTDSPCWVRG